jgi:hypothetical protein
MPIETQTPADPFAATQDLCAAELVDALLDRAYNSNGLEFVEKEKIKALMFVLTQAL